MKNNSMKRIHKVIIKRTIDDSPDTSWLGEYSNESASDYSIDRKHSLDCLVNAGLTEDTLLWYTSGSGRIEFQMTWGQAESVSHSGECDGDVLELSKVPAIAEPLSKIDPAILSAELKEYGAWDSEELADHEQNLQRLLWLAGGDLRDNKGCTCGESGDVGRNEYRYFNPNWENYKGLEDSEIRKYCQQDYKRMESLNRGNWCFIGVSADAEIVLGDTCQTITSGGLWGIESDSGADYFAEVEQEQLAELRGQLHVIGFSKRAIASAFKNVERGK